MVTKHSYLPITATSPQRPLSFVPKVAVVQRFDYKNYDDTRIMLSTAYPRVHILME